MENEQAAAAAARNARRSRLWTGIFLPCAGFILVVFGDSPWATGIGVILMITGNNSERSAYRRE